MKKLIAAAIVIGAGCFANDTRADDWYGYQIVASDLTTVMVTYGVAIKTKEAEAPFIVGAVGYLAAPFAIHMFHGEPYRAIGSAGLRLGSPLLFGLTGAAITSSSSDHGTLSGLWGALMGAAVGAMIAVAVDAAALAYESKDDPAPAQAAQPLKTISIGGSF